MISIYTIYLYNIYTIYTIFKNKTIDYYYKIIKNHSQEYFS